MVPSEGMYIDIFSLLSSFIASGVLDFRSMPVPFTGRSNFIAGKFSLDFFFAPFSIVCVESTVDLSS